MGANKHIVITAVCSVVVVAMVVAAAVFTIHQKTPPTVPPYDGETTNDQSDQIPMEVVKAICQPAEYKETCEQSFSKAGNTTNKKHLIKASLLATLQEISTVMNTSDDLGRASKDPEIADAHKLCHELLDDSLDDLRRAFDKFNNSDLQKLDDYALDLNIWLAGSLTCQETCLDIFEDTKGGTSEKMKQLLKTSREMTSNALTILDELPKLLSAIGKASFSRSLLSNYGYPSWVSEESRRLLQAGPGWIRPDVVVAQDGSGKYRTVNEALKEVPVLGTKPFVIYIKAGVYAEYVAITKQMTRVMLIGDGPTRTKITGNRSHAKGFKTFSTATVAVDGFFFVARDIGIENTAGSIGHQAVALRSSSDMSVFYNCQIDGYQDTLYVHDHRQFYRDCTISGTIDFIFGNAAALFQNCNIIVRKPDFGQSCMVTAQGRTQQHSHTGIVLQNCVISAAPDVVGAKPRIKSFLGRPWKNYSRTIVLNSRIDSVIEPEGWSPWVGEESLTTCWYAEYGNRGSGADLSQRVRWPCIKKINNEEATRFTPGKFLLGDAWIPASGVPYERGMIQ